MSGKLNPAEVTVKPVVCCKRFESCMVEQKIAQHLKKKRLKRCLHISSVCLQKKQTALCIPRAFSVERKRLFCTNIGESNQLKHSGNGQSKPRMAQGEVCSYNVMIMLKHA